jgi:hypothetical protein
MVTTADFEGHRTRREERHSKDALRAIRRRDDVRVSLEIVPLVPFAGLKSLVAYSLVLFA